MPSPHTAEPPPIDHPRRYAALALLVLLAGAGLHVLFLISNCPFDLSGDEAHYWEWSRHLDWSYYSKGPLVAWIIAGGRALFASWSERVVGDEMLAVRLPAIILSILTGMGVYTLAAGVSRRPIVALAAVLVLCTIPIFAVGSMLMTIDAPLACCYVWTLVACLHGLRSGRLWPWLAAGVLIAIGLLAKYNMVLVFPAVGLALLTEPSYRPQLRRPGPYLATLIGLLGLVPIVVWNAQHDWVSMRHVAGQAGVSKAPAFDAFGPLMLALGQAAVIGPIWYAGMFAALWTYGRAPRPRVGERHDVAALRLLIYATLVPWGVFAAFSFITKVQPNWPVMGVLPATVLLVMLLSGMLHAQDPRVRRRARNIAWIGGVLGVLMVGLMHSADRLIPLLARLVPPPSPLELTPVARVDPAVRLRGWKYLGQAVGRQLAAERTAGRAPFIVTDDYQLASQIAFYTPGEPAVYCLQAVLGDRESQYDLWPNPIRNPEQFIGRPCLYIGARKPELFGGGRITHAAFRDARKVEEVEYRVQGHPVQFWPIYAVEAFDGLAPEVLEQLGRKF